MSPDQFSKFYRFIFHICREPGRRNIPMELAVAAWRLIMPGRFRLLDRWCAYAAASHSRVVTEDTWRQVLDFSRTIHEDLSNYDVSGAWAVILDEFVEDMRVSRRRSYAAAAESSRTLYGCGSAELLTRQASAGADLLAVFGGGGGRGGPGDDEAAAGVCQSFMPRISPRCGSKRREPDVDVVAEQLSAMPLGAEQHCGPGAGPSCLGPVPAGLPALRPCGHSGGATGAGGMLLWQEPSPATQGYSLQYGGYNGCSSETMAKRLCLDRQQQQHPQQHMALQPGLQSAPGGGAGAAAAGAAGLGGGVGGRAASGGQPMCCSTGPADSEGSQGPAGAAAMDCLQDPAGAAGGCQPQLCQQQRRAIKARRSGLSDIVKSAVSDALGF